MHLLVAINNNIQEWRETLTRQVDRPRLPLPYAFGGAFVKRGHKLSAINVSTSPCIEEPFYPFEAVYPIQDLSRAMKAVDLVALWGGHGISAVLKQIFLAPPCKCVVLNSYVWKVDRFSTLRNRKLGIATQLAARFAKAVVVMTGEQAEMAGAALSGKVPVIYLRCGIDTAFYGVNSNLTDVPENYRGVIEKLLVEPYIILPGDELRFNQDALDLVTASGISLVRISQYSKDEMVKMQKEIRRRGIEDRFFIFEKISYPFMRFLLQHATLYVGLVNSEWQPAGWTVACEALASGVPVVAYEGLVTRELVNLGAPEESLRGVPMGDIRSFQKMLEAAVSNHPAPQLSKTSKDFAALNLNLEITGDRFVQQVEQSLNKSN